MPEVARKDEEEIFGDVPAAPVRARPPLPFKAVSFETIDKPQSVRLARGQESSKDIDLDLARKIDFYLKENFIKIYPDLHLLEAAVSMFTHQREGDQLRHIFNTATINSYNKLTTGSNNDGYYIPAAEREIIHSLSGYFTKIAHEGRKEGEPLTLFDLGTGTPDATEQKIIPILNATGATRYVAVDEAVGSAAMACHTLSQLTPDLELFMQRADFNTMDFSRDRKGKPWKGKRLFVQLGGTGGNMAGPRDAPAPEEAIIAAYANIRRHMSLGEHFIQGLDHNSDAESVAASYTGELHDELGLGLLERIYEDLPHKGFDPGNFEIVTGVNPENGLAYKGYRAIEAGSFILGKTKITHEAGEVFVYNNSWKLRPELAEKYAEQAGLELRCAQYDSMGRVCIRDFVAV